MYIIVIKGQNIGDVYPLERHGPILVGRDEGCNIRVLDLLISRKHCQIEWKNDSFYLKDLHSTNKTIINGRIITDEEELNVDDLIDIGNTRLLFTDQKNIDIKSVAERDKIRMEKTRRMDSPPN